MATSIINCAFCGRQAEKENSAISKAKRNNNGLYCGRECSGLARRKNKTDSLKRLEKREYDKQYRLANKEMLKEKKADWFKKSYDPKKAKIERKKRAAIHAEYCRRPEYKKWKKEYDRTYRAKKYYGEFWESFLLLMSIRGECLKLQSDYEIRLINGTLNKTQKRKRNVNK